MKLISFSQEFWKFVPIPLFIDVDWLFALAGRFYTRHWESKDKENKVPFETDFIHLA